MITAIGLQICDGRGFLHKYICAGLNFWLAQKLFAERETSPITNMLLATVLLLFVME
jgi:hypothetical protein